MAHIKQTKFDIMKNSIKFALIFSVVILLLFFTDTIGFWGLIGLMFLMIVISAIWSANEGEKERKEKRNKLTEELKSLDGFYPTKKLVSPWGLIAIDDKSQQIAIRESVGKIRKYPYSAILSCEVLEDGETTYRKSSTIGRAIVGGVIAGGAGAIIGGLSGKEKQNKEIKNLDFKLVMKDTNNPSFKIRFFDSWEETNKTKKSIKVTDSVYGPIFEKAANQLKNWKDTIEVIIDNIDSNKKTPQNNGSSISDELTKLNELKEKGILTEEEFQQ